MLHLAKMDECNTSAQLDNFGGNFAQIGKQFSNKLILETKQAEKLKSCKMKNERGSHFMKDRHW